MVEPTGRKYLRVVLAAGDLERLAVVFLERDARAQLGVLRLGDALARQARDLVELLGHRDALDDVAELHDARDLGEDRHRERVPTPTGAVPGFACCPLPKYSFAP
jgi:hypothetical protein